MWPSDSIRRQTSCSTLIQPSACPMFEAKTLFDRCLRIANMTFKSKLQRNLNQNTKLLRKCNLNAISKMLAILLKSRWVKYVKIKLKA